MSYDRPFLTAEQRQALDDQQLDWQRHNLWRLLTNNGTNPDSYGCLCSKCKSAPKPDVRES